MNLKCRMNLTEICFSKSMRYASDLATEHLYAMGAKSKINIKSMAKYERSIGKVHKAMRRMGYQSKEEGNISISKGYILNAPVSARDFAYASEGYGPPKHFKLGTATVDSKLPYEDLATDCKEGELVVEVDVGTFGRKQYLVSKCMPTHYGVVIPLGEKTKQHRPRSRRNLKKALDETVKVISNHGGKIKYIVHDGEKSLAGNSLNLNDLVKEMLDEYNIIMKTLPKGVHSKNVENLIKQWKSKGRQINFALPYMVPSSMLDYLAVAAIMSYNISPTSSNVNHTPPLVLMSGKSIDYNKFCVSSFGEVVYTSEDNGYLKNNIGIPRSKQCLYLFPTGTDGGHAVLPIDNPKSGVVIRTLKQNDVMKVTPIDIVVKMNRKALSERSKRIEQEDKNEQEKREEEDQLTGYTEDLLIDVDPQFSAAADSVVQSIGQIPGVYMTINKEEKPDLNKESYKIHGKIEKEEHDVVYALRQLYGLHTTQSGGDAADIDQTCDDKIESVMTEIENMVYRNCWTDGDVENQQSYSEDLEQDRSMESSAVRNIQNLLLLKKEVNLKKAYKKFDPTMVKISMKKELQGLIDRNVWTMKKRSEVTEEIKSKSLPGCPKIRMKSKDGIDYIKSRYP